MGDGLAIPRKWPLAKTLKVRPPGEGGGHLEVATALLTS